MTRCQYRSKCKEYESSCIEGGYCGLAESFMEKKTVTKYQSKHFGKIKKPILRIGKHVRYK